MTVTEPLASPSAIAEHTPSARPGYLADRLPITLEAISKWPDYNAVMLQLGQTLERTSCGLGWTLPEVRLARRQKLIEIYESQGCFRFADPQKMRWMVRIIRRRPTKSYTSDAIGIGGPVAGLFSAFPATTATEAAGTSTKSDPDPLPVAVKLFDVLATQLGGREDHSRQPRAWVRLTRAQIECGMPVTDQLLDGALGVLRNLRVFRIMLSSRTDTPRVQDLSDAIREVNHTSDEVRFRLHPSFIKFFSPTRARR